MTGYRANFFIKKTLIALIRLYQYTFGCVIRPCCRFYPSCSNYAILAIDQHGVIKGFILISLRLFRCNPFNLGGIDLIPEKKSNSI